jgi:hypothetical protein
MEENKKNCYVEDTTTEAVVFSGTRSECRDYILADKNNQYLTLRP